MNRWISAVLLCFAAACARTSGIEGNFERSPAAIDETVYRRTVFINNARLEDDVQVVELKNVTIGNLMKAQVTIRSLDHDDQNLQYRFGWYDANDMEIDSGGQAWQPIVLHGMETKTIQAAAPHSGARRYTINLRTRD